MIAWVIALIYVSIEIQLHLRGSTFVGNGFTVFRSIDSPKKTEVRFLAARMRLPGSALFEARADRGLDRDRTLRAEASRPAVRFGKDA